MIYVAYALQKRKSNKPIIPDEKYVKQFVKAVTGEAGKSLRLFEVLDNIGLRAHRVVCGRFVFIVVYVQILCSNTKNLLILRVCFALSLVFIENQI